MLWQRHIAIMHLQMSLIVLCVVCVSPSSLNIEHDILMVTTHLFSHITINKNHENAILSWLYVTTQLCVATYNYTAY